mmetsp:Transcript_42909/g.67965  ORF Transcript_42909/g.67965 Transcript_42909/m.67965 type:complete len:82 (-) Transcript_42909:8-253(-)
MPSPPVQAAAQGAEMHPRASGCLPFRMVDRRKRIVCFEAFGAVSPEPAPPDSASMADSDHSMEADRNASIGTWWFVDCGLG